MAKINAYGAREVARCTSGRAELRRLWVMTSDGRILVRYTSPGTEFSLMSRGVDPARRNENGLRAYITALRQTPD